MIIGNVGNICIGYVAGIVALYILDYCVYYVQYIADEKEIMKVYTALQKYFPSWVGYNMAKCGGCIRACVSMLEKKGGCMEGRFEKPLRTKKAWRLDR